MSVNLGKNWDVYVKSLVASGQFHSAAEAVHAGLRLLREEEEKLTWLREKVGVAEARGGDVSDEDLGHNLDAYIAGLPTVKRGG